MSFIEIGGIAARYVLQGQAGQGQAGQGQAGPLLVLIHEMGGSLDSWDDVAERLQENWRVLRYDVRGAGLSEKLKGDVTVDVLAKDLIALLDALDFQEPVYLAGSAVGAAIAIASAALYPSRIAALALLSPATGIPASARMDRQAFADLLLAGGMRALVEPTLAAGYPPLLRAADPARYAAFRARWLSNDPESYRFTYRMLIDMDLAPYYGRVVCPVLGIGAEHDALRPPASVQAVVAHIPSHRFTVLPTGHHASVQTPVEVASALDGFFSEVAGGATSMACSVSRAAPWP